MKERADIKDEINSIVNNDPPKIDIVDYLTILIPTGGMILGGLSMIYNVYKFGHPDLLIPAIIIISISVLILVVSLRKLKKERSYEYVVTNMSKAGNTALAKKILNQLFGDFTINEFQEGIVFVHLDSFFSWGKQVTIIPIENVIFYNFCDLYAPFSLISRGVNLNKIKRLIEKNVR